MIPGKKIKEAMMEHITVVSSKTPNLFKVAALQVIKIKEAMQEVVAPPSIVAPMFLNA